MSIQPRSKLVWYIANEFIVQIKWMYVSETLSGSQMESYKENWVNMYVTKGLQRNEILSYMLRDFPQYSWSIRTLDRRMLYFNISYYDKNVSLNAVKEVVREELNGPGKLLGYRAMHFRIRQKKRSKRYKGSTLCHDRCWFRGFKVEATSV